MYENNKNEILFLPLFDIFDIMSTKTKQGQTILVDSIDLGPN